MLGPQKGGWLIECSVAARPREVSARTATPERALSLKCPGTKPDDRPEAARGGSEGACKWKCQHVYVRDMPRTLPLSLLRVTKGMGGKGEG